MGVALPERIFVAAHVTRIYGPVQALQNYLKPRARQLALADLPFAYAGMQGASVETYEKGRRVERRQGHASRGLEPWLWAKDFWFVLRQGWRLGAGQPMDLFIGIDSLNAAAGRVLKWFGRVNKVVFYVIDYTPRRFKNPVLNAIYHAFDRFAVAGADQVWNLSERMREVRKGQGLAPERNRVVPVGVELDKVTAAPRTKVSRKTLVYMGALHDNKGLQLLIEAMPAVLKKVPGAKLEIYGFGPFENELKRLIAASPAKRAIRFKGGLEHGKLFKVIPKLGVALAPYLDDPDSYTYWCDPTKPKEYLACGLPLIITKVPWLWERVADRRKPLGLAIAYNLEELVAAAVRLLGDSKFYWRCRGNALKFASALSWDDIYAKAFKGLAR